MLRSMTKEQRLAAYEAWKRGDARFPCLAWASLYPDEVPLLNGEFEFIAMAAE